MSKAKCAICGKPVAPKYRPFCSARCADVDLGRWLKGGYAIPGEPAGEEDLPPPGEPGEDDPSRD